jgi:predicted HTH transcriptional regulator
MGAIPSSDLPGHKQIRERVVSALQRCQESQDIDFKESVRWPDIQWKVTKSALGMGNLRDGGIIIVGVSQRNGKWTVSGITNSHLQTYDPDVMVDQITKYVSPNVDLDIVTVEYDEKIFVAIRVREFTETPLVCKKSGPAGSDLLEGAIYIRPLAGRPRTTRIKNAGDLHDLLELAAEKRARRMLETSRRIGIVTPTPISDPFDDELGDL